MRPTEEETSKELLARVQAIYTQPETRDPRSSDVIRTLYSDWLGGDDTEKARRLLHTSYKEVEKMANALTIKW